MKNRFLLFVLLINSTLVFGQFAKSEFPIPAPTANRLFYLQRSSNSNCVLYDAVLTKTKQLSNDPVHGYWIRYAEGGIKKEFNTIQRTLAYGFHTDAIKGKPGQFEGNFVAYKKRKFTIQLDKTGKPVALFPINGKSNVLDHVWVQIDEDGMTPKIGYVELFGHDLTTGAKVYEKFKPQ
jgi:hypothetical protein